MRTASYPFVAAFLRRKQYFPSLVRGLLYREAANSEFLEG